MPTGSVKKFFPDKGFGFLARDDGGPDLFAAKRFFRGQEDEIREGLRVTFETAPDDKNPDKERAVSWSADGGGGGGGGGGAYGGGGYGGQSYGGRSGGGGGGGQTGTLKKYLSDKSFGFIKPDNGSEDVFAPLRTFKGKEHEIQEGMTVTFEAGLDDRTGKTRAASWSAGGGGGGGGGGYAPQPGGYGADPRSSPYGGAPPAYGGAPPPYGGAPPPLPPGWECIPDPASGKPYYCNRATGESSWTPPPAPQQYAPPPVHYAPPPPPQPQAGGLPPGWEQAPDPASGKPYYFNRATGQTTWDRP